MVSNTTQHPHPLPATHCQGHVYRYQKDPFLAPLKYYEAKVYQITARKGVQSNKICMDTFANSIRQIVDDKSHEDVSIWKYVTKRNSGYVLLMGRKYEIVLV
jgi:hypothetical protein